MKTRHLVTLLLLSTILPIQNAQSLPPSLQALKAPELMNWSNSTTGNWFTRATTYNESDWHAWHEHIRQIGAPKAGCFHVTYPSTVWNQTDCVPAPLIPFQPSPATVEAVNPASPAKVGNGFDDVAYSSSTLIGSSIGTFQTSGLTSETDSNFGANAYTLQLNSDLEFTCTTTYTGGKSSLCWEQFVFFNYPDNGVGLLFIQYWLINYYSTYGSCPSTGPPGGSSWMESSGSCYANSPSTSTPLEAPTNLANLSLEGFSNYNGAVNDVDMLCITGGGCYSMTTTEQVVNLYQSWQYSEFNVFGAGN
ncbi:MAG TPA: hypothetical protein VK503_02180, partial [Candidatus Bathyarchaeia archaeon]|nr:hypothetical protein [Candidatus Bathyarchaeia archaeon]